MEFEKLLIHEVDWPHVSLLIISSREYPELGILAFGEQEKGNEISIIIPDFVKPLVLSKPCGCCTPHLVGTGVAEDDDDLAEQLRYDFITALRSCCKENGITSLLFQEFDGDLLWMAQDKEGLHLIDLNRNPEKIDFARFKRTFSEMILNIPGFRPEDLAKY